MNGPLANLNQLTAQLTTQLALMRERAEVAEALLTQLRAALGASSAAPPRTPAAIDVPAVAPRVPASSSVGGPSIGPDAARRGRGEVRCADSLAVTPLVGEARSAAFQRCCEKHPRSTDCGSRHAARFGKGPVSWGDAPSDPLVAAGVLRRRKQKYSVEPPPGGWCDAAEPPRRPVEAHGARAVPYTPPALHEATAEAVVRQCEALRADLTEHMLRKHGGSHQHSGTRLNATWASHGGGIVRAHSQGSTSLREFAFVVRLVLHEEARRRSAAGGAPSPSPLIACETGFNWGTSSLAFLCASPHSRVHSFDLARGYKTSVDARGVPYLATAAAWLQRRFPGRLNLVLGDSAADVPRLAAAQQRQQQSATRSASSSTAAGAAAGAAAHGAMETFGGQKCDVVLVDGGHEFSMAYADMRSFRCAARRGALMLADDCDFEGVHAKRGVYLAYRQHLAEGRLEHLAAMNFSSLPPPLDRWGCLARYV